MGIDEYRARRENITGHTALDLDLVRADRIHECDVGTFFHDTAVAFDLTDDGAFGAEDRI